jgi:phosphotransferase system enzyme I (PtsI)
MKTDQTSQQQTVLPGAALPERMLRGLGVSPGIAVGPAYVVETGNLQVP